VHETRKIMKCTFHTTRVDKIVNRVKYFSYRQSYKLNREDFYKDIHNMKLVNKDNRNNPIYPFQRYNFNYNVKTVKTYPEKYTHNPYVSIYLIVLVSPKFV